MPLGISVYQMHISPCHDTNSSRKSGTFRGRTFFLDEEVLSRRKSLAVDSFQQLMFFSSFIE